MKADAQTVDIPSLGMQLSASDTFSSWLIAMAMLLIGEREAGKGSESSSHRHFLFAKLDSRRNARPIRCIKLIRRAAKVFQEIECGKS